MTAVVVTNETEDPINVPTFLADIAERVVVTFLLAVVSLASSAALFDIDMDFGRQLGTAGLVAACTAFTTIGWPKRGFGLSPLVDVASRSVFSAAQGATGIIAADAGFQWYTADAWQVVGAAAFGAGLSVVKGYLATRMSSQTITPASLATVAGHRRAA